MEAVTKRFFTEYADVFGHAEESVKGVPKGEARRLYTQRLMNRLMFLYFIQRKGWLTFGGDKRYLRALFQAATEAKEDFLNDRLYWTFFAGLNTPNEDKALHAHVDLKERRGEVPFLNGGLFDLEDEYDVREKVKIPNKSFAAIFELFERYNFTVTESTPLDVEVAVDPEMLGKVFEELVTGRHETGSYYTPRPIVAFMCTEALKHYLNQTVSDEAAVARFVDEGDPSALSDPEAVLNALRSVKVCDPACGSGAYLLGMMQELLRLREALFATKGLDAPNVYKRKLEIIQNNLYGVDIDLFAVNIAKLRLWLSLAVDFEGATPPPLPKLDFKIECGDSLMAPDPQEIPDLFRQLLVKSADRLAQLKGEYLSTYGAKKKKLAQQIKSEESKLLESLDERTGTSFVDWRVAFAEVFKSGGFDIVLANPPYVRHELIKEFKSKLKENFLAVYSGTADLYVFFYARAIQLLRGGGTVAFISSNKWFRADYGTKLREHVAKTCGVRSITDFKDLPVFQPAIAYAMVFIALKGAVGSEFLFTEPPDLAPPYPHVLAVVARYGLHLAAGALSRPIWAFGPSQSASFRDGTHREAVISLRDYTRSRVYRGLTTGFNEAFVLDRDTRARLITLNKRNAEIIKPLALGRDVTRWAIHSEDRWLIVTPIGVDMRRYPEILDHLRQWERELRKRYDQGRHWWELRACDYYNGFEKQKIVSTKVSIRPTFALETEKRYLGNTAYFFPVQSDARFLLGILNSAAFFAYAKQVFVEKQNRWYEVQPKGLEAFPIASASPSERQAIEQLVDKCIAARGSDCEAWEREIDERVAALYGL
ncbi:MAG: Eco57I restriction-modification methylase domain-containing protein [Planctomycetes bacterium]|nr:Eco57I restriction-modification methylase domain-containing protein [Planctomycetota bacterium]